MPAKKKDRFASLRTSGPGYETKGKENFDHMVEFVFDYSKLGTTTRIVRKELGDFGYELYKAMKPLDVNKQTGFIYSKGLQGNSNAIKGKLAKVVNMVPDPELLAQDMGILASDIAAESKATMKKYIGSRVDTTRMKSSVYGRVTRRKNKLIIQAGWLDLWYKYFGFQEKGFRVGGATRTGSSYKVPGMRAVLRTYLEMAPWVQKGVAQYFRDYTRKGGYKK